MRHHHRELLTTADQYSNRHIGWAKESLGDAYDKTAFEGLFNTVISRELCDINSAASIKRTSIQIYRLSPAHKATLLHHTAFNIHYCLTLSEQEFARQVLLNDDQLDALRALTSDQKTKLLSLDDTHRKAVLNQPKDTISIILKASKQYIVDMFSAGSPLIHYWIQIYKAQNANSPSTTTAMASYSLAKLVHTAKLFEGYTDAELNKHLGWLAALDLSTASALTELEEAQIHIIRDAKAWPLVISQDPAACAETLKFIKSARLCTDDDYETQHKLLRNSLLLSEDQRTKLQGLHAQLQTYAEPASLAHDICLQIVSLSVKEQQSLLTKTPAVIENVVQRIHNITLSTIPGDEPRRAWELAQRFGIDETLRRLDMQAEFNHVRQLKQRAIDLNGATIFSCRFFSIGGRGAAGLGRPDGTYHIEEGLKGIELPERYPIEADSVAAVDLQIEAARTVLTHNASISLSKPESVNRDEEVNTFYLSIRDSWPDRVSTASPVEIIEKDSAPKPLHKGYH